MRRREVRKEWPALDESRYLGKRVSRVDGPDKVSGRARYTYDIRPEGLLYAKFALARVGRARVRGIDVEPALRVPGVVVAHRIVDPGSEVPYAGFELAVVAAETEEAAREGAHAVRVELEPLAHNVRDDDPTLEEFARAGRRREQGDVDEAFEKADRVVEGEYGCPIVAHCCLESHGSVIHVRGETVEAWFSTQRISSIGADLAGELGVDVENVHAVCQHLGGGFGSKFQFDVWDRWCARISEETGRPVKAMLDRDHEIMVAGSRPSAYGRARVAVRSDGRVLGFDFETWGSGGPGRGRALRLPYLFGRIPHRTVHTNVRTNTGPDRAWRAPSHPQMCLIQMGAMEDAAAALGMDPLDFFLANLDATDRPDVYREQLELAAELIDWRSKWKPRDGREGTVRRGLGLSMHTWGGRGHDSNARVTLRPDGTILVECGTQDLGVGSRTVLAVVVAETLGVPIERVRVEIGDNRLPPSGPSGGSTTVGGISSAGRTAAVDAARRLLEVVAQEVGADSDRLELRDGRVVDPSDPSVSLSFDEACALLAGEPVVGNGRTDRDLIDQGVGGVQMSEVEVDLETGVVRMVKHVAVQDCGTVVDLKTAESQVYGGCIMGIATALFEERIMDPVTGACLNPDLEFYRIAGIGDVGEIVVRLLQTERHHRRGVIGLGEPPVISPLAAVANAVANAVGMRVPRAPFTPRNVLAALGQGAGR